MASKIEKFGATKSAVGAGTPFSTSDGKPRVTDGSGKGQFDALKNARGTSPAPTPQNYVGTSRPQRGAGGPPPAASDATAGMRRQVPTTAANRLGQESGAQNLPTDGSSPLVPHPTVQAAWKDAGCGSVGNERRPFKLKGG